MLLIVSRATLYTTGFSMRDKTIQTVFLYAFMEEEGHRGLERHEGEIFING